MSKWHVRYSFPVSFPTEPVYSFDPAFDNLFIRIKVYDELDQYLNNIHAQHGKFWISSPSGGYGKSTMLHYVARKLYSKIHDLKALPLHIFVGDKAQTVEHTFIKGFLNEFLKLSENLSKVDKTLKVVLSADMKKYVLDEFDVYSKEIKKFRKELTSLSVGALENKFYDVLEKVLQPWTKTGIFSKYVLLIDEMDKLDTADVLSFLSGNQHLFERLYQEYEFVAFLSGHKSWVERIRDGTEYSYYHGKIFRTPPFIDVSDIQKLVETRLVQYLYMVPSDNPWTEDGYEKLRELTGGVPRIILQLAAEATNEAQSQNLTTIGPGIVEEVLVKEEFMHPIEEYLKNNYEAYVKLKAALDKRIASLLYIFYDMPGHQILKEYDKNLTNRTRYLGIESSDEKWIEQVKKLVHLECLSESEIARELSKDLCDLFDIFHEHPALIQKVVPTIVRKLGEIEPKRGKIKPPDYQKIIERCFVISPKKWVDKKTLFERFLDSTSFQAYLKLKRSRDRDKFSKEIFKTEFKRYRRTTPNLMIFKEGKKFYYRHLPRGMQESDYSILKMLQSREVLDKHIDLIINPMQYDSNTIKELDQLIESILCILGEARGVQLEPGFLRKRSRHRIFKELELNSDLRRRLDFYSRESKEAPRDKTIIQEISRKIVLDLAREYDYVTSRAPALKTINAKELIEKGENEKIEFKSSMCWNYKMDKKDKLMELPIAKTVSAFMNSEGGYLLIGVEDNKEILGLDKDFAVIRKPNKDGYRLHFTGVISKYLGKENRLYTKIFFETLDSKTIAIVKVNKSPHPVFIKFEGKEEFYIRLENASSPLNVREAAEYIKTHWS